MNSLLKKAGQGLERYIRSTDRWLLFLCLALSVLSALFLYGLTGTPYGKMTQVYTQIIATFIGVVGAIVLSLINYKNLVKLWKLLLPVGVLLVVLTFFIGVERGSNRAWLALSLGGLSFTIQPAEFLKIVFILTFSKHVSQVEDRINRLDTVVLLGLHGFAYVGLVLLQRDAGTALVFLGMFIIMIFMAGISWKYILLSFLLLIPVVPLVWNYGLSPDQKVRFQVLQDPSISEKYAFHQIQGLKALGLGGATGVGFKGKHVFVPESYNDFIFTYIGQVSGFVGLLGIIILLLGVVGRLLYNGYQAKDTLSRMLYTGVLSMILVQSIMNIGMCINVLPVIGVTLPFLSAGGSSVVSMYWGIGVALSTYRHQPQELFATR